MTQCTQPLVRHISLYSNITSPFSTCDHLYRPLGKREKKSKGPTVMRRWMVMAITQLNPQDKLASLITQRQWQSALELAQQHHLSPDDVYK